MSDFEKQFGKNLKKLRQAKKLSQEQLAEKLEMGSTTISKIENGKIFVTSETLENITKALDIKVYELFLFEGEEPADILYKELTENLKSNKIKNDPRILSLLLNFTNSYLNK